MIGKIQRVPIREVWKHEAHDFTRWLKENIDVLDDVLDFTLTNAEREQSAGDFSVDLVAQDDAGNPVIIENQFGKSDHDHLGKLITYAAALDAKRAVWIVGEARAEHVQAVTSLNESKATAFYVVKLEGIRINDSLPAPLFTLIVGPSEEGRQVGAIKKEMAEIDQRRQKFWSQLLAKAKERTSLHANITPGTNHWSSASAGKGGLVFSYIILKHEAAVELYIDRGKESQSDNKAIFDALAKSKNAIEKAFGSPLEWMRLEAKRASRIKKMIPGGGLDDEEKWPETQTGMVDTMLRFEKALKPYIDKLDI